MSTNDLLRHSVISAACDVTRLPEGVVPASGHWEKRASTLTTLQGFCVFAHWFLQLGGPSSSALGEEISSFALNLVCTLVKVPSCDDVVLTVHFVRVGAGGLRVNHVESIVCSKPKNQEYIFD